MTSLALTESIPVTILTGFLGAGKTTLINRILHADHGLKIAVLVNDFGKVNIDAQLVVGVEGESTINLSNGCICCTIRDDLLRATREIIERENPPDYIVVEPSGVSDPVSVAQTFSLLRPKLYIDSVLAVVDCEQLPQLSHKNQILALNQIGLADIILLNKVDLVSAELLGEIHSWIERITERPRILETVECNAPLELLLGVGRFVPEKLAEKALLDVHVHPEQTPHYEAQEDAHDDHHDEHHHGEFDPHIWQSVTNAELMVETIRDALVAADSSNAATYQTNAENYLAQLSELESWVEAEVAKLPAERRKLVTSHDTFGYFAERYGFSVVGTALAAATTEASEPSAADLAALVEQIKATGVPAIFAENISNPRLMEQIAAEATVTLGPTLYTDALGEAGSDGETYIKMMRYNVQTIVTALGK